MESVQRRRITRCSIVWTDHSTSMQNMHASSGIPSMPPVAQQQASGAFCCTTAAAGGCAVPSSKLLSGGSERLGLHGRHLGRHRFDSLGGLGGRLRQGKHHDV